MENGKIVFDITKFQSAKLQGFATAFDKDGGTGLSEGEQAEFTAALNGNAAMKAELANESDDVKGLFGFTASAPASTTEAAAVTNPDTEVSKYAQVKQEYTKLREAGEGPYEAYEAVKKAHKGDKEYKKAIKSLKGFARNVDAQIDMIKAVDQSNATKSKQVKKDAKATLAEQDGGKIDKWHKRAANGSNNFVSWVSGEDSAMKEVRKAKAWGNRAKQIEKDGVSMETIVDKLGEKCPYLQTIDKDGKQVTLLEAAGLISQREDGVYDITELSHFIQNMGTGGDNNQSRQENKSVREAKLNIAELNAYIKKQTGVDLSHTRIKDKYSKRLVKLTGRHVEHKNYLGDAWKNTIGGALAAAAGTVGALLMQKRDVTIVRNNNNNYLELNLSFEGSSNIKQLFDSFAEDPAFASLVEKGEAALTQTESGVQVIIDQRNSDEIIRIADKHLLSNALKSAAIGGAIGLLASALTYGKSEQEVIPHVTDCKTLDEFNTYIDSLVTNKAVKPLYGEIAKRIAVAYSNKDGSINCDEMNKFLGYQASNGSRLNRAELMTALNNLKQKLDEGCYKIETKVEVTKEPDKQDDVATIHHAAKYGWTNLGRLYDCFNDMSDKQAWRAMQVIQAIDPEKVGGKYRADQIREIVTKAFANSGEKPNWKYINSQLTQEFNFIKLDTLKAVLSADYAGTEVTSADRKIRKGQDGYDKVNIVVAPITLYNADGTEACTRTKDPNKDTTKYTKGNGTADNKVRVSTHYTQAGSKSEVTKFRGNDGETVTDWYGSDNEADTASKNQFKGKKRCN